MKLGKGNACYTGQSKEAMQFINHHASFQQITLRFYSSFSLHPLR